MKKALKIFYWIILVIIVLIITLTVVAKLAENKITAIALKKVSEEIEAPVEIKNVSFSLIRKFPLATIELDNVQLGVHKDSSAAKLDTIIHIDKIYVSVKSRPLIHSDIEIMKVDIDGASIKYLVDTSGVSNIDFLLTAGDTVETQDTVPSKPLNITLTDLSVKNVTCKFEDRSLKAKAKILIPELKVKADIHGENISASVKGKIRLSNCDFAETNLYLMNKTNIDFDVDYTNDSLSIKQLDLKTDGADLNLAGNVLLGDNVKADVTCKGSDLMLNELIKYAPNEMLNEFGLKKLAGNLDMHAKIKGIVSDTEIPQVDLNVNLKDGNIVTSDYPELKNISFSGKITNGILHDNKSTQADFNSFHFETGQSKFDIAISLLDIDHPKYVIKSDMDVNVGEFKDFIPDSILKSIDGQIKARISTKGELPDSIGNDFVDYIMANSSADVELENFNINVDSTLSVQDFSTELSYKPGNLKINNLNILVPNYNADLKNTSFDIGFKGSINNLDKLALDLKSYHIETNRSEFSGKAEVRNLNYPDYRFNGNINLNLDEVKTFLPDTLVTKLSGSLLAKIESSGKLNLESIADQAMDIVFKRSTFNLDFRNVSVELPDDSLYQVNHFSGLVNITPEAITLDKMSGVAAGIDFKIDSTEILNSYETFIKNSKQQIFTVQTNITLGEITNSLIGAFTKTEPENADLASQKSSEDGEEIKTDTTTPQYLLPDLSKYGLPHFLIRGKLAIAKLEYEKNNINDISLNFRFADSLYVIDQFKMKTCKGELNTSLKLDARRWDKPVIDVKNYITGLDVRDLLKRNDNFGDTTLTYEKLSGILTSEMHVRLFYEDGEWPTDRIRAKGIFTLEDGKIYDYEPLVDLSKNKILGGLKGLDKLDFNTLTTSLFLFKDKIYIPKTDVVTSSMDITAFAMQSLKDEYEYHLKIHLGDVLTGKSDKLLKEQAKQNKKDGSTVERNGLKLVSMKKDGNKKNGFDNDKLEKEFLKKLNKQQGWLRLLFNPNLVNFSTDLDRTKRNEEIIEKYDKNE